jgi:hypothetical protein
MGLKGKEQASDDMVLSALLLIEHSPFFQA